MEQITNLRGAKMEPNEQKEGEYFPFVAMGQDAKLIVRVREDGTHEYGEGVTDANVWKKIAELLPRPPLLSVP